MSRLESKSQSMPTETGVVGSAGKEQPAVGTEEDANSNLISNVERMCSSNDLDVPTKETLKKWMLQTTSNIRKEKFWSLNSMVVPAEPLDKLCPRGNTRVLDVFLLTLWARFSPCCRQAITHCLRTGTDHWKEGLVHLQAYVLSIRIHVWYTLPQLVAREKEDNLTQSGLNVLHLEAHCLNQAVVNSSNMFRILSNQNPTQLVLIFHKYLTRVKPQSKFHKKLNQFNFDYKEQDTESVTHVSIADYLNNNIVLHLRELLALNEIKELFSEITKSQVVCPPASTDAEFSKLSKIFFDKVDGLTTKVLEKLGVNSPTNDFVEARFLGFAIYAEDFIKRWGETNSLTEGSDDERFMRRLFKDGILVDKKITALKNLVENKDSPLFDMKTASNLINSRMASDDNVAEPGKQKRPRRGKDDEDDGLQQKRR